MNSVPIDHYLEQRNISWNPKSPDRTFLSSQPSSHKRPIFVGNKQLNPHLQTTIRRMQDNSSCSLEPHSSLCKD